MNDKIRIDKWLWMVRIFKTRNIANEACNAGKVKINGISCKASKEIKKNIEIQIRIGQLLKTVKVLDFPKSRLSAKLVPDYCTDMTPQEEYDRLHFLRSQAVVREHGLGRPTKRDRRQLDYLKKKLSETNELEDK